MDQDQLAEISSHAISLEKAINNGEGQRDETSRQRGSVALTMRGSPSFVFPLAYFSWEVQNRTDGNQTGKEQAAGALAS